MAQHSFCGMCGAKLPSPLREAPLAAEAVPTPSQPPSNPRPPPIQPRIINGPSLLGLGSEPTERERISYLLEDDPGSGTWRRWAAVVVLLAIVGVAGWRWRTAIRAWVTPPSHNAAVDTNSAPQTTPAPENAPATAPANPQPVAPAPAAEGAATSSPPSSAAPPPEQSSSSPPTMTDAVSRAPETKEEKPPDAAANPATTPPPAQAVAAEPAAPKPVEPKAAKPEPAPPRTERKAPAMDASAEALESQGENYLYGRGVEADCGRAGKSLLAAAAHSSIKAQSVLGTMYATGHCVTRDVPAAYRWFAKALHQDPGNVRLQRDLEVLWQQMTPEEREIATKAE
ncbi:MAG: tetratricopeptide repeat protein [Gaiellaceae bacterium]